MIVISKIYSRKEARLLVEEIANYVGMEEWGNPYFITLTPPQFSNKTFYDKQTKVFKGKAKEFFKKIGIENYLFINVFANVLSEEKVGFHIHAIVDFPFICNTNLKGTWFNFYPNKLDFNSLESKPVDNLGGLITYFSENLVPYDRPHFIYSNDICYKKTETPF
jgi:hypothetical protein